MLPFNNEIQTYLVYSFKKCETWNLQRFNKALGHQLGKLLSGRIYASIAPVEEIVSRVAVAYQGHSKGGQEPTPGNTKTKHLSFCSLSK